MLAEAWESCVISTPPTYGWLQQAECQRDVKFTKVAGAVNCADLGTKALNQQSIDKHMADLSGHYVHGRAELAPELHSLLHKSVCLRHQSPQVACGRLSGAVNPCGAPQSMDPGCKACTHQGIRIPNDSINSSAMSNQCNINSSIKSSQRKSILKSCVVGSCCTYSKGSLNRASCP